MKTDTNQTELWTVMRLVRWGAEYFKQKRVDSPRLTVELMLAHVLGLSRFELYLQFDRPLTEDELTELRAMIHRRVAREPLQYILGEAPFYGRTFEVNPSVLIPRPETELLVEEALRRAPHALRCLDIGTGSGCIAVTMALERPGTEVVAIDSSTEALDVALRNAERLGAANVSFEHIDFFDDAQLRTLGSFDLIISNPPYIPQSEFEQLEPEVRDHEPQLALTDNADGLRFYRHLIDHASHLIRDVSDVFLEIGYGQSERLCRLFADARYDVDVLKDLSGIDRILWVQRRQSRNQS